MKKKTSTLTIILAVVGGIMLLGAIGIGVSIYLVMSSDKGRAIVGMVGEGMKITAKAQKAPGTKELRAMGCQQAMVMEMADLEKIASFLDAGSMHTGPDKFGEMVVCNTGSVTSLTCDRVAATYVGVVGTRPQPFVVNVQQPGGREAHCSNLYDGQSKLIKPLKNANAQFQFGDPPSSESPSNE